MADAASSMPCQVVSHRHYGRAWVCSFTYPCILPYTSVGNTTLLCIMGNSEQQIAKLSRTSSIWGKAIKAIALSAFFLIPLSWMCMHNPTQGYGLAVSVVIINDKLAKIECLLVILTFFLRDVWFLGGWG